MCQKEEDIKHLMCQKLNRDNSARTSTSQHEPKRHGSQATRAYTPTRSDSDSSMATEKANLRRTVELQIILQQDKQNAESNCTQAIMGCKDASLTQSKIAQKQKRYFYTLQRSKKEVFRRLIKCGGSSTTPECQFRGHQKDDNRTAASHKSL